VVTSFSGSAIYHLLAVAVFYLAVTVIQSGTPKTILLLAISMGLLTMARSEFLLLGAIMLPLAIMVSRAPVIRRLRLASIALGMSVFLAVIAPWTIRNYILFDRFVPVVSHPWFEIWRGNNSVVAHATFFEPTCDWVNPREFPQLVRRMDSIPYDRTFEPKVNDLFKTEATGFIFSSPLVFIQLGLKKILFLFTTDASDASAKNPLYVMLMFPAIVLIGWGMFAMFRHVAFRPESLIPVLFLCYYAGITVMTYALPRYQIYLFTTLLPVIAPGIDRAWSRRKMA
jgi:hypothetical protein